MLRARDYLAAVGFDVFLYRGERGQREREARGGLCGGGYDLPEQDEAVGWVAVVGHAEVGFARHDGGLRVPGFAGLGMEALEGRSENWAF